MAFVIESDFEPLVFIIFLFEIASYRIALCDVNWLLVMDDYTLVIIRVNDYSCTLIKYLHSLYSALRCSLVSRIIHKMRQQLICLKLIMSFFTDNILYSSFIS